MTIDLPQPKPMAFAPPSASTDDTASAKPRAHFVSRGEKQFDRRTYWDIGAVANALVSVAAIYWAERTAHGQKTMKSFIGWTKKMLPSINPDTAQVIATKSLFLSGGFAMLWPMKRMEDKKPEIVKDNNRAIYGDAVDTDPVLVQSQKEIEAAPKQGWMSIIGSRALALVPFYITIGLLWDRKSVLSRATNGELRAMGKDAMHALEKNNPAQFSKVAGKGLYFDRPIAWASRALGKGWAKLSGNTQAVAQIETMAKEYPGMVRSATNVKGGHDPIHSAMPYYFISEAITTSMVAWGVYALTRVLGPIIGVKPPSRNHHPLPLPANAPSASPASAVGAPAASVGNEVAPVTSAPSAATADLPPASPPTSQITLEGLEHSAAARAGVLSPAIV